MRVGKRDGHADAGIRDYADADENLLHIIHIKIFAKKGHF